ncbi:MAG: NUDIX domain-containing protein, partial [Nitrospira sp.]|nr:NUDIX domain-containing protein [Nitrospira sp.]
MRDKPKILSTQTLAQTRLFRVEQLDLQFSNGAVVQYERLHSSSKGAVLVVPMLDQDTVLLIREYAAGVHRYELGLPKGLIEPAHSPGETALKEAWEEAGLAYKQALKEAPFDPSLQNKYALARERAAAMYEERGRTFLNERRVDQAIEQFKRALTIEPSSSEHQASLAEAIRLKESRSQYREAERLVQLGRTDEAIDGFTRSAELDPAFREPLESISRLTEEQQALMRGDRLKQPVTLKFRNAGIKEVLEGVAKAGGLTLIFDKDVRNDPISIAIQDTPFEDALQLLLNSNNLFSRAVSPGVLIISPNTKQKQEQYQDLMIRTFYLSSAKSKDMLTLLKSMLDSKRMHANEQLNTIVIRDQPEKIQMAEKIILANDRQESEVLFDVEVLEVNRTVNQNYGLTYPKQVAGAMVPLPPPAGLIAGTLAQQFSASQLSDLGPGNYLFKLPTNIQLDFFKQITDAKTLAAPKIRVMNNRKAEINIGDKQPILLSTTNVLPGQAATGAVPTTSTVTSIEFRDTGVKLAVEPSIRLGGELGLKMKIEVIRLGEQVTLQASPPITQFKFGNRSAETMLSIKDGETIVLGGLLQEEDRKTKVTIPWIGDLPFIGNLISSFRTDRVTTEVILTITPHIVQNMTPPALSAQTFWSGTESTYATGPMFSTPTQKVSANSGSVYGEGTAVFNSGVKGARDTTSSRSLAQLASPDPVLAIHPDESAVKLGKEIKLSV